VAIRSISGKTDSIHFRVFKFFSGNPDLISGFPEFFLILAVIELKIIPQPLALKK